MNNIKIEPSIVGLSRLVPSLKLVSFAAILFGTKFLLIDKYGNATPYWDQWDSEAHGLYMSFLNGRLGWEQLVAAHNEHRILIPRLLAIVFRPPMGCGIRCCRWSSMPGCT